MHLYWPPSTDSRVNGYRVYEGNMIEKIENNEIKLYFLKDGKHCPLEESDDKIPYDHYRKICYTEDNFVDIPICEEEDCKRQEYYLLAPLRDRRRQIFQCFNGTNYFPLAYISEGPFCPGTGIKRERGTCHCPEDGGCGGFYEYFPQPGDRKR